MDAGFTLLSFWEKEKKQRMKTRTGTGRYSGRPSHG